MSLALIKVVPTAVWNRGDDRGQMVEHFLCMTIEGNTSDAGSANG